jgi:hypothetical protein
MEQSRFPTSKSSRWHLGPMHWLMVYMVTALGVAVIVSKTVHPNRPPKLDSIAATNDHTTSAKIAFRNTGPEVKYVGDESCAACHPTQAETYRHHPMGQALAPIATIARNQHYGKETHNPFHPFDQFNLELLVQPRDGKDFHKQSLQDASGKTILEHEVPVDFVLGSGTRGRSYLINRDGFLFQSPISWFSQAQVWDLSPGFEPKLLSGRKISANCLFCHSNRALPVAGTINRYRPPIFEGYAIGCERCHGPGELHVHKHERNEPSEGVDDSIVNPARLPPTLREAVCQQCHLLAENRLLPPGRQAFDYRPGLPLHEFWAVFVLPPRLTGNYRAVSQVEQMYVSRCFRASNGKMGCIRLAAMIRMLCRRPTNESPTSASVVCNAMKRTAAKNPSKSVWRQHPRIVASNVIWPVSRAPTSPTLPPPIIASAAAPTSLCRD